MPDTTLLPTTATQSASGEDVLHLTCCDDDTALCGLDVSAMDWSDDGPLCVPCEVEWVTATPCPVTGCWRGR